MSQETTVRKRVATLLATTEMPILNMVAQKRAVAKVEITEKKAVVPEDWTGRGTGVSEYAPGRYIKGKISIEG